MRVFIVSCYNYVLLAICTILTMGERAGGNAADVCMITG